MADDAVYDGNATASSGSLSFASPVLTWTGDLAVGASATITYTVTVNKPGYRGQDGDQQRDLGRDRGDLPAGQRPPRRAASPCRC